MNNLFCKLKNKKYISAKSYLLIDKIYFIFETENKFFFCEQNKDSLNTIAFFSKEVQFICDNFCAKVYAIKIIKGQLKVILLPEKKEYIFALSSMDEFIVGLTAANSSLLVKTCQDLLDDTQKINMYYIDLNNKKISVCNDANIKESYHMPYISICDNGGYILAENAIIDPYEIEEAQKNTPYIYRNDILMVPLQELQQTLVEQKKIRWDILFSAKKIII